MTGLGEDVYTDRSTALDALTAEGQRLGLYGDAPDVDMAAMVRESANAICRSHNVNPGQFTPAGDGERYGDLFVDDARAALESLGIPLSDLEGLKAGRLHAVSDDDMQKAFEAAIRVGYELALKGVPLSAAPKTPEAAR